MTVTKDLSGFSLSSKAMLVTLRLSAWGGQRLDRSETSKVAKDNHAQTDAVKVTKNLVGKDLDPVRQSERAIRAIHRHYTLPWADDSTRLLTVKAFEDYLPAINKLIEQHEEVVVPAFLKQYREVTVPTARDRLGNLFDANDFPDDIASKFGASVRYLPVPDSTDVRVKLSNDEVAALRQEVEEATREAYEAANAEIVIRAERPLARLAEALRDYGPGKRFSKSLLENVAEIADMIPSLDLSGRPEVTALAKEIAAIADHNIDRLTSPRAHGTRVSVANEIDRLSRRLTAVF